MTVWRPTVGIAGGSELRAGGGGGGGTIPVAGSNHHCDCDLAEPMGKKGQVHSTGSEHGERLASASIANTSASSSQTLAVCCNLCAPLQHDGCKRNPLWEIAAHPDTRCEPRNKNRARKAVGETPQELQGTPRRLLVCQRQMRHKTSRHTHTHIHTQNHTYDINMLGIHATPAQMHTHTHTHTNTHTHTYIHTHTRTHTQLAPRIPHAHEMGHLQARNVSGWVLSSIQIEKKKAMWHGHLSVGKRCPRGRHNGHSNPSPTPLLLLQLMRTLRTSCKHAGVRLVHAAGDKSFSWTLDCVSQAGEGPEEGRK